MTTAQDQQSRAEFERDMPYPMQRGRDGEYINECARTAWFAWQAARALPAGMKPRLFLHTLDTTDGIPGNATHEVITADETHPFGEPGISFSAEYPVTTQPLFTAAQVLAMGRVPPCPYPCGWDGLHKIAVADGAYLARTEWPEDEEGVSVKRATVMRNIGYLIDVCRAMLAAAPRPPAAQEESNAR